MVNNLCEEVVFSCTWVMGSCGSGDHVYYQLSDNISESLHSNKVRLRSIINNNYSCVLLEKYTTSVEKGRSHGRCMTNSTERGEIHAMTYRNCRVSAHCHQHSHHLIDGNS